MPSPEVGACITLTTDFGHADWFVAAMKGVIAGIAPDARVVDITHAIPAGDIRGGAFALAAVVPYFPPGTIHVAVIDPGVGSARAALAVETDRAVFLGPDNGVLSWALRSCRVREARRIENARWMLPDRSATFHGRDVFAPAAAHLANGRNIEEVGRIHSDPVILPWPEPRKSGAGIAGEVIHIDHFGNAITNLGTDTLRKAGGSRARLRVGTRDLGPIRSHYQSVPAGEVLGVLGSCGLIEISVNQGHAADLLGLRIGTAVLLETEQKGKPATAASRPSGVLNRSRRRPKRD